MEATVTPAPTAPALNPVSFQADRYLVCEAADEYLGDSRPDYEALVDAVCTGAPEVALSDPAHAARAVEVFAGSPYSALAALEVDEAGTVTITPSGTGSADEFDNAAETLVEGVLYEQSNALETALALYRAVSAECTYEENDENSLYRMLVERRGGSAEFAEALQYLFLQNNIPAQLAYGTVGDVVHVWVIAQLNGNAYHFDPTFENGVTGGRGLSYFGMSDTARVYTGCTLPCTVGQGGYAETVEAPCPDTYFDDLFTDVTDWENDVRQHFVYLAYGFEDDYLNSIQTDTLVTPGE